MSVRSGMRQEIYLYNLPKQRDGQGPLYQGLPFSYLTKCAEQKMKNNGCGEAQTLDCYLQPLRLVG